MPYADSTRKCIGCSCHKVAWNQGSDYCNACTEDSYVGYVRDMRARKSDVEGESNG